MIVPNWLKKVLFGVAAVFCGALILAGYYYMQLTADAELAGIEVPSSLDLKEATRKLQLFEGALKASRPGFVRLSEVEINAYLQDRYGTGTNHPAAGSTTPVMTRCVADLTRSEVTIYTWVSKPWLGRNWSLVWQRNGQVARENDRWGFKLNSMQVGHITIPEDRWKTVFAELGGSDSVFDDQLKWLSQLPSVQIRMDEMQRQLELRLYTYQETNIASQISQ